MNMFVYKRCVGYGIKHQLLYVDAVALTCNPALRMLGSVDHTHLSNSQIFWATRWPGGDRTANYFINPYV